MEVIFLIGTAQAFFLSILIFTKENKSTGDYVLGAWMALLGLHLLDSYFHTSGLAFKYPHLLGLGGNFPILQGPFMFVYVLVMIDKTGRFKFSYLLHGLPFLVITLYYIFVFYLLEASEKLAYFQQQFITPNAAFIITSFLNVFLGPVYVVWSLVKLRKHAKNITEQFSYTEQINLNWLKYVVAGLGFVWVTVLITNICGLFSFIIPGNWTTRLIYLSVTAVVFFLGYFGFKQQAIYVDGSTQTGKQEAVEEQMEEQPKERYKKSGLSEKNAKEYLNRLLHYMDEDKPYLNGKLNIKDVASHLDISINHLSQVINGQLGVSFFDLINKYRVDEVISSLSKSENKQFTLLAIAYNCGFCSKSSFNNIFKKITGYTPSEYIKAIIA
jgi:AraC-like DNA-binding protein